MEVENTNIKQWVYIDIDVIELADDDIPLEPEPKEPSSSEDILEVIEVVKRIRTPSPGLVRLVSPLINKGTGAGGHATNLSGKAFEQKTSNYDRLLQKGFQPCHTNKAILTKQMSDRTITFVSQRGLHEYMFAKYKVNMYRCPDEAYIIEYAGAADSDGSETNKVNELKILEKKNQNRSGSVIDKLWTGHTFRAEYQMILEDASVQFQVSYGFCVSEYLANLFKSDKHPKFRHLRRLLDQDQIGLFFGEDEDYYDRLDRWVDLL